jgi:hypothetical protein
MTSAHPRLSWWRLAAAGLAAGVAALLVFPSCNTPFIPLPPPGDPTFTPMMASDGVGAPRTVWEARGNPASAMSEARVFIYNIDGGSGVIVRAQSDGSYASNPIDGKAGDRIQLRYESPDGRHSPDICRLLQQGVAQTECTP